MRSTGAFAVIPKPVEPMPQKGPAKGDPPPNAVVRPNGSYLIPVRKGEIRNPTGGQGHLYRESQRICREATPDAARKMVALLNSEDERIALLAANAIFERAFGKPRNYDPAENKGRMVLEASKLTDHQLEVLRQVMNSGAFRTSAETTDQ